MTYTRNYAETLMHTPSREKWIRFLGENRSPALTVPQAEAVKTALAAGFGLNEAFPEAQLTEYIRRTLDEHRVSGAARRFIENSLKYEFSALFGLELMKAGDFPELPGRISQDIAILIGKMLNYIAQPIKIAVHTAISLERSLDYGKQQNAGASQPDELGNGSGIERAYSASGAENGGYSQQRQGDMRKGDAGADRGNDTRGTDESSGRGFADEFSGNGQTDTGLTGHNALPHDAGAVGGSAVGAGNAEKSDREVRLPAQGLSENLPSGILQGTDGERQSEPSSAGHQRESARSDRQSGDALETSGRGISGSSGTGRLHEARGADEQLHSVGRGNSAQADNLRINPKIIGNIQYRYIKGKSYLKLDTDTALRAAEEFAAAGMKYSGRITGDSTTLTVPKADLIRAREIVDNLKSIQEALEKPGAFSISESAIYSTNETPVKQLSKEDFIGFAADILRDNQTVRNAHEHSDAQNFELEVQDTVNGLVTDVLVGTMDIPQYTVSDIAPFYSEFQENAALRREVYTLVAERVNQSLNALEAAREKAKATGLPFSERFSNGADDEFNPYVYDGSMSPEDFAQMQEAVLADRFSVIETDKGYAVWDDIQGAIYVDEDGITAEFTGEWEANTYLEQLRQKESTQNSPVPAAADTTHTKTKSASELVDGDIIRFEDKVWRIGHIDGDFSAELENTDSSDSVTMQAFIGHWREKLEKLGFEYLPDVPAQSAAEPILNDSISECAIYSTNSEQQSGKFSIYQIKNSEDMNAIRFESLRSLNASGKKVLPENYNLVYTDNLDKNETLDDIFTRFNINRPEDFTGHSLSVSDVVVIERDGKKSAHYVDSFGFAEIPEFLREQKLAADGTLLEADTTKEFEDAVKNGQTISLHGYAKAIKKERDKRNTAPSMQMSLFDSATESATYSTNESAQNDSATESATYSTIKHDFHITYDDPGVRGAKAKYRVNAEAIRTLQRIEAENRLATPDEQETLVEYVGWGGLPQVFDTLNSSWSAEFTELRSLLSPEEYESARASTLNAHYTSPMVIEQIYSALSSMGFKGGNVLEPSMGIGNFFGKMPQELREKSRLFGVELDSVSGRIAKQLYQNANVSVCGFEKTAFPDNFFDVAVGNVPFGGYKLSEQRYDKHNFNIHDHFFAKALDKVRPGGIVAFITSKGTLDKQNPAVRKYLAQRAELVGAVRLPNDAFKANAGTEVTSDIIFLQKRDRMLDIAPEWVHISKNADNLPLNQYFIDNPDMVLGEIVEGNKLYGNKQRADTMCIPIKGANLREQLREALSKLQAKISTAEQSGDKISDEDILPADPDVRNFSYTVADDKLYYRENAQMFPQSFNPTEERRMRGMIQIRDCVRDIISMQLDGCTDHQLAQAQAKLEDIYSSFTAKNGLLSANANARLFKSDASSALIATLEKLKDGKLTGKADIFSKRTITRYTTPESADTSAAALAVSIAEKARVDMEFMAKLTGFSEDKIAEDLRGVIYRIPLVKENDKPVYAAADEYLSGNIRTKLAAAREAHDIMGRGFEENIAALEKAMPQPLEAGEIDVRLGAPWISAETVSEFVYETLGTPYYLQKDIKVQFSKYNAEWNVSGKSADKNSVAANVTFGTERKNAYQLIEDCLNLRDTKVWDRIFQPDGSETRQLNKKETMLAQQKQEALKTAFRDWIFKDPKRRQELVEKYNVLFNSTRPREYDGSHLNFVGMNANITLRPHQRSAVAHALYGGNTLFAHEVGAGKTFEMIAAAMEGKRLGLHSKSMLCVPNHLTEQIGADFMKLYPNANILVATEKDFTKENRHKLCAKIAMGDFDAVIIGHSQLIKIPVSPERQERMIREQISEIVDGITDLKERNAERFQVKQLEKTKKALEARLDKLLSGTKRDDVVTFEELGVDKLIVDEAHLFKNLFLSTKMRNVAGISSNDNVQKTADLYMKCQYMDEITDGKGIIFATGTPIYTL